LVALCQYRFFTYDHVTDGDFLKFRKLRTLQKLRTLHNGRLYLMHNFLFLFNQVETATRLVCALLVLGEYFRVILETPPFLPLLPKSLHLLDANQLCNLGSPLLHENKFCAKPCHFRSELSMFFFRV
jgi:hypothetical protein